MSLKPLKTLIRTTKWALDEKQRELKELYDAEENLLLRQKRMEEEKKAEDKLVQENPELGMTYANFLQNYLDKRDKLILSLKMLRQTIEKVQDALRELFGELKTYEVTLKNQEERAKKERELKMQTELDEIGLNTYIRRKKTEE